MHDVITYSALMAEADRIKRHGKEAANARWPSTGSFSVAELVRRYDAWYAACLVALPEDLAAHFAKLREPGTSELPTIGDFLYALAPARDTDEVAAAGASPQVAVPVWVYHEGFLHGLDQQREQVFFARRRRWTGVSALPEGMAISLATICKKAYQRFTIDDLFIQSGCEPGWHIPPFKPVDSERMNVALGWFDGLLLHAPDQERRVARAVCEVMLAKPSIKGAMRAEVERWLGMLKQDVAPVASPLDRFDVHPSVRQRAGALVANGHYSEAILKVFISLNDAVKTAAARTDLDGTKLMQQVFSPQSSILRCATDSSEQQGWMFLFTGAIQAIRNPRAHRLVDDSNEAEAMELLLFASALFRALDGAQRTTP